MSILVHLYYTGKNGSARKFAEEMESSGTAGLIREEAGNEGGKLVPDDADPVIAQLIENLDPPACPEPVTEGKNSRKEKKHA